MKFRLLLCFLAFFLLASPPVVAGVRDDVIEILDCYISEKSPGDNKNYCVAWRITNGQVVTAWMKKTQYNNLVKRTAINKRKMNQKQGGKKKR